jgi:excinuclease UvrABC nuclease subunit
VEKFGRDFFKNAPVEPGVYVIRGARDRVLYVGPSHNLKVRLAY